MPSPKPMTWQRFFLYGTFYAGAFRPMGDWASNVPGWIDFGVGYGMQLVGLLVPGLNILFELAEKVYGFAIRAVGNLADVIEDWVLDIIREAVDTINFLRDWATESLEIAFQQIQQLSGPIWDSIRNIFGDIARLAGDLANFATDTILPMVMGIIGPIVDQLTSMIEGIAGIGERLLSEILGQVEQLLREALEAALEQLAFMGDLCGRIVSTGLRFALNVAEEPIDVIRGAWKVLVWIATNPMDVLENLLREAIEDMVRNNYALGRSIINSQMDTIENLVSDLLGIDPSVSGPGTGVTGGGIIGITGN
jgi:phage-related protein